MSIDQVVLEDEILKYVEKVRVSNGMTILTRFTLKYEEIKSEQVTNALKRLVETERLTDLYPRNIKANSAHISEIFYMSS